MSLKQNTKLLVKPFKKDIMKISIIQRIIIIVIILVIGLQAVVHGFNVQPIIGLLTIIILIVTTYFIIKPLTKNKEKQDEKNNQ